MSFADVLDARPPVAPLPAHSADLPRLRGLLARRGVDRVSIGEGELFDQPARMVGLDSGAILVFRHDDLRRLGPDPRLINVPSKVFVDQFFSGPPDDRLTPDETAHILRLHDNMVFCAPTPVHRLTKPLIAKPFMPNAMPPYRAMTERICGALADRFVDAGAFDFLEDFAQAFAFAFWAELFGMTEDEVAELRRIMVGMAANGSRRHRDRAGLTAFNQAVPEYLGLLTMVMRRARERGDCDIVNWRAEQFAGIDAPSAQMPEGPEASLAGDMIDGFHALGIAIANCVYALVSDADAYARARCDPGLVPGAVTEALRLYAPVRLIARYSTQDMDYDGMHIPAHTSLWMYWGAGNRDPAVFERRNTFDVTRNQALSTTFGGGAQICPGRNLARALAIGCLSVLVRTDITISITQESQWMLATPLTGGMVLDRYPMRIDRA